MVILKIIINITISTVISKIKQSKCCPMCVQTQIFFSALLENYYFSPKPNLYFLIIYSITIEFCRSHWAILKKIYYNIDKTINALIAHRNQQIQILLKLRLEQSWQTLMRYWQDLGKILLRTFFKTLILNWHPKIRPNIMINYA